MGRTKTADSEVIGRCISYIYRRVNAKLVSRLKDCGLSSSQSIVLVGIYRHDGINQKKLSVTISMTAGLTSRVLTELEKAGLIERELDENNRRNHLLHLTALGRELTEESLRIQSEIWYELSENFSADEWKALSRLLERLDEVISS